MAEVLDASRVSVSWAVDRGGRPVDGEAIRVAWRPPADLPADRLFHVYVNGELALATGDPAEREALVAAAPAERNAPLVVAVVAVSEAEAEQDFTHLLTTTGRGRRALLRWPRLNGPGPGSTLNVFGNGGAGEIDFGRPLNAAPIDWFPDGFGQWGFACGEFGLGQFGWELEGAAGLGIGAFGMGPFGLDVEWASWLSEPLAGGQHRFAVVGYDGAGNAAGPVEAEATIPAAPPRATALIAGPSAGGAIVVTWRAE